MILQNKSGFVFTRSFSFISADRAVKELVNTLGFRIATGYYGIGKSIPMEPELVAEHGVSRTVVREAIKVYLEKVWSELHGDTVLMCAIPMNGIYSTLMLLVGMNQRARWRKSFLLMPISFVYL